MKDFLLSLAFPLILLAELLTGRPICPQEGESVSDQRKQPSTEKIEPEKITTQPGRIDPEKFDLLSRALNSLGWPKTDAKKKAESLILSEPDQTVEQLIMLALKRKS